MTLPTSGAISLAQIAAELGIGLPLSLTDSRVLALAGKSAPPVTMPGDFYGKSANTGPAPTPFSVTKRDGSGTANSTNVSGTVTAQPSVQETGGVGPYSRTWSFTENPSNCTLADASSATCTVWKTFVRNSSGEAHAVLQCVSMDSAGGVVTTTGINADLEWTSTN